MFQAPTIAFQQIRPLDHHHQTTNGGGGPAAAANNNSSSMDDHDFHSDDDDVGGVGSGSGGGGKTRNKSRRELPSGAVATLKAWLLSPEHFTHPYPTPQDQVMLMQKTGIDKKQLKNWFTNARRRIWKPMLKKQLEQGKISATAAGGVVMSGTVPGLMVGGVPGSAPPMTGADQQQLQYQQQGGVQIQEVQVDQYGNPVYQNQGYMQPPAPAQGQPQYYDPNAQAGNSQQGGMLGMGQNNMAGATGIMTSPNQQQQQLQQPMIKTDSHAVLMELFARDQDLVRQATESAAAKRLGDDQPNQQNYGQNQGQNSTQMGGSGTTQGGSPSSQHPMKTAASNMRLSSVPTLNSWPHFSSVSSLNNLGTMPGVKSITSLSAADVAKQGPVNTVGNLAQVKSVESMGKNDSYAFLEVFFGERSSNNLSGMGGKDQRGMKREREEDNEIGLSLDEEPSSSTPGGGNTAAAAPSSSSFENTSSNTSNTLKRAYDDAIAAQGLLHISRSNEKLTDLALPAKMQKTLSQEFARQHQQQQEQQQSTQQYSASNQSVAARPANISADSNKSHQYPAQPTAQSGQATSTAVQVPPQTKCAICGSTTVDTQLRPCGHMFHERCLKPLLEQNIPPKCPCDGVPIESALLAIPMENSAMQPQSFQMRMESKMDNRPKPNESQP
mmetsp:Transcript_16946/g.41046  ORF Transcript_16946/g.41046 Transcript_16946/m.41046 type:complete len:667 (-) Transcript_16946:162-2162(-)